MASGMGTGTIIWSQGGSAAVVQCEGVHVTVRSDRAFPPGAPAAGSLCISADRTLGFTLKVASSRSVAEGVWEVRGRLVTATREVLDAFARAGLPPRSKHRGS